MPVCLREPSQEDQMKNPQSQPENDQREKKTIRTDTWNVLRPYDSDSQDERDRQETNTRQPLQPFPCRKALIHCSPAPFPWHPGISQYRRKSGGQRVGALSSAKRITSCGRRPG